MVPIPSVEARDKASPPDDPPELWRWVVGYEGLYMVSNMGRVMSVPAEQVRRGGRYYKPGKEVRHHDNGRGYRVLSLHSNGIQFQTTVHRLVATAFIPNPENLPEVNHIDGNKANNRASNLEWVTKSQNMRHAVEQLDAMGFNRRFSIDEIVAIRTDTRTEKEIGDEFGVAQETINAIRTGRTYRSFPGPTAKVGRARQRKLTQEQVREIRLSDKTGVELSMEYGISCSTVSKIRNNKSYKESTND